MSCTRAMTLIRVSSIFSRESGRAGGVQPNRGDSGHTAVGAAVPSQAAPEPPAGEQAAKPATPARIDGTVLQLSTDELLRLAPRLRGYLATPAPSWPEVVDAADWLRCEWRGRRRSRSTLSRNRCEPLQHEQRWVDHRRPEALNAIPTSAKVAQNIP